MVNTNNKNIDNLSLISLPFNFYPLLLKSFSLLKVSCCISHGRKKTNQKYKSAFPVQYLVRWHQKMLYFMKCFPQRLSQIHMFQLYLYKPGGERLSPFLLPVLRGGWRKVKIFSLHELPKTLWLWGDPTKVIWAMEWKKWGKLLTLALVQLLTRRQSCQPSGPCCCDLPARGCRWGRDVLHSSDLGWLESVTMWLPAPQLAKTLASDSSPILQL